MNAPIKPSEMIVEGSFKVVDDTAKETPAAPAPAPEKLSRRGFLKRAAIATAGAGAAAALGRYEFLKPEHNDFALLKMDPELNALGLMHRTVAMGDTEASIDPAKASFEGIDPRTLAADGHESLVISPELHIAAQDDSANNIDRRDAKLAHAPENLYIPYHLFADARSFDVRAKKTMDGQWKLCIEIIGVPEASKVPVLKAVSNAVSGAASDAVEGTGNLLQQGMAWVEDKLTFSDGEKLKAVQQQQHDAEEAYEHGRPHPSKEAIFSLQMDFVPGKLPNLLFFNGRTLDNPTYMLRGDRIEATIRADNDHKFAIIPNNGIEIKTGIGEDGIPKPRYITPYRFFDKELATKVENARLLADSTPENGYIPDILHYLSKKTLHDDKLNGYEMGALAVAARTQQRGFDENSLSDRIGNKLGFVEKLEQRLPGEIPGASPAR